MFYLEDKELARKLIEVGYHGKGDILSRQQFEEKKQAIAEDIKNRNANQPKVRIKIFMNSLRVLLSQDVASKILLSSLLWLTEKNS